MPNRELTRIAQELVPEDEEPEQLALFGAPVTEAGAERAAALGRRGPGRPLGSRNIRTQRGVAFLMTRYRDPRAMLLEIAEANVDDLAALAKCTPLEALAEKRLAATAVLPFVAARITPEQVTDARQIVHLTINAGAPGEMDGGVGLVAGVVEALDHSQRRVLDLPLEGEDEAS